MLEFEDLPRKLQKLLTVWIEPENWGLNLSQACEKAGVNYKTARNLIWRVGTNDFYELKARLIDKALLRLHDKVMKSLKDRIEKGSTRAIELYLRTTGRMTDRLEVSGSLDISIKTRLSELKKRAEELDASRD